MSWFAHQAATRVVLRDLWYRASHVHVDDVGAHAFDDLRGGRHFFRVTPENLNRDWPLLLGIFRVFERSVDAAYEPFRADHFSDDQTATTVALDQTPKRRVRHPRHGSDSKRRRQLDVPYPHFGSVYLVGCRQGETTVVRIEAGAIAPTADESGNGWRLYAATRASTDLPSTFRRALRRSGVGRP